MRACIRGGGAGKLGKCEFFVYGAQISIEGIIECATAAKVKGKKIKAKIKNIELKP